MATRDIIVLGGSTGAIEALQRLCADLPADLPAAVFSVLHVGHGPDLLASMLDQAGPLPAVTAEDGVLIERGKVYVAPADHHLILQPSSALVAAPELMLTTVPDLCSSMCGSAARSPW